MIWLFFRGRYPGGRLKRGEEITLKLGSFTIRYRWGASHWWGCDDAGAIIGDTFAVFDGISITPEGYGVGGMHAAELAKRFEEAVELIRNNGFRRGLEEWSTRIGERYTTAVIVRLAEKIEVAWVGDSFCSINGEIVTYPHSRGNILLKWFGLGFSFAEFPLGDVCATTDGLFNPEDDILRICWAKRG